MSPVEVLKCVLKFSQSISQCLMTNPSSGKTIFRIPDLQHLNAVTDFSKSSLAASMKDMLNAEIAWENQHDSHICCEEEFGSSLS